MVYQYFQNLLVVLMVRRGNQKKEKETYTNEKIPGKKLLVEESRNLSQKKKFLKTPHTSNWIKCLTHNRMQITLRWRVKKILKLLVWRIRIKHTGEYLYPCVVKFQIYCAKIISHWYRTSKHNVNTGSKYLMNQVTKQKLAPKNLQSLQCTFKNFLTTGNNHLSFLYFFKDLWNNYSDTKSLFVFFLKIYGIISTTLSR